MLEQITKELLGQGLLGVLLVASWVIIVVLWNDNKRNAKDWDAERNALYQEARKREQEQFALMTQTFQANTTVLIELKTMLANK